MSDAVRFLRALWGDHPAGLVQAWELRTKKTMQLQAVDAASIFDGGRDVYTCVALAGRRTKTGRPKAGDASAIAGMWADIDIKPGSARDEAHAHEIARALAEPTILVHSGHGLQAWWLLHEPWAWRTLAEQTRAATIAAQWGAALAREAQVRLDPVWDLARLMRLPGTINAKSDPVPVRVLQWDGPRHQLDALARHGHGLPVHTAALEQVAATSVQALPLSPELREKLILLLQQSPAFAAAWRHTYADLAPYRDWTASEWDMAVASWAARGEHFTDQDIASLVRAHRLLHRPGDPKADRARYLALTVQRARGTRPRRTQPAEPRPDLAALAGWGRAA